MKNEKQTLPANGFMHEPANLKLQSQVTVSSAKTGNGFFAVVVASSCGRKNIAVARISPISPGPGRCA